MKKEKVKKDRRTSELESKKNSNNSELLFTVDIPRGKRVITFRFNNIVRSFND